MADVSAGTASADPGRAQLLLVSALGLAALLVVLALILNTVIYTEHEAARETAAPEASDLLRSQQAAIAAVQTAIATENAGGHRAYADMTTNLTRHVNAWSTLSGRHAALATRNVGLEMREITNGTRIIQDGPGVLTNAYGAEDWTLVAGVTESRQFELTADRASLVDVAGNDSNASVLADQDVFAIRIDGNSTRAAFLYRDGSDVVVGLADQAGDLTGRCRSATSLVTIDFVNETVDGVSCAALSGFLDLRGPADIEFQNGESAAGTYVVVVDEPALDDDLFSPGGSDTPRAERLIYEVAVRYHDAGHAVSYDVVIDGLTGESP
jgi:hypothetical protein